MNNHGKLTRVILFLIIIFSVGSFAYNAYKDYRDKQADLLAEEARRKHEASLATQTPSPRPVLPVTPTPTPTPTPKVIRPRFEAMIQEYDNDDIVGYLKIDGTTIDYPVVKSADNEDYLTIDIYKRKSSAGSIFMDYENNVLHDDKNTVIYGHNMKADIMFHSLRNYRDEAFFLEHRFVTFDTLYEDQTWEVFSFYKTDVKFSYTQVIFQNDEDFYALAQSMKAKSMYDTGVEISPNDRILTLSTCSNAEEDTRYVLNARLVKPEDLPRQTGGTTP